MDHYQQRYENEQQRYAEMTDCYNRCLVNENYIDAEIIFNRIIDQDKIVKNLQLRLTLVN